MLNERELRKKETKCRQAHFDKKQKATIQN